jgi:hypothetical protein
MAVIDERGRLFGRINVIDAAVGAIVVGLIPLAYFAWLLFQQPEPRIVAVDPPKVQPTTKHVKIRGENLRPFMRVSFNEHQGVTFALHSPDLAEVQLPELRAGTYDLILYDVAREVTRLPGAVVVEAAPLPVAQAGMLVAGSFVALDEGSLGLVAKGREFTATGNNAIVIVEAGPAQTDTRPVQSGEVILEVPLSAGRQVAALLKTSCTIVEKRCLVGGVDLEPGFALSLFAQDGRPLRFVVSEVMPDGPVLEAELGVRFLIPGDAAVAARVGDRDRGSVLFGPRLATITALSGSRRTAGNTSWQAVVPGVQQGNLSLSVPEGASVVDATLHVALDHSVDGPRYRGRTMKTGVPFVFETDRYVLRGWVLRIAPRSNNGVQD